VVDKLGAVPLKDLLPEALDDAITGGLGSGRTAITINRHVVVPYKCCAPLWT
jgi:hypothetical protein